MTRGGVGLPECKSHPVAEGYFRYELRYHAVLLGAGLQGEEIEATIFLETYRIRPVGLVRANHSIHTSAAKGSSLSSARASRHAG